MIEFLASFIAGSIPTGYIIGRINGVDVRKYGSGNIGATNVARVLGIWWGIIVFILDFLKGAVPVYLVSGEVMKVICGSAAILGHAFTPFLRFRGGKAVATSFGVMCFILPYESIVAAIVFLIVLLTSRIVGFSSIIASVSFVVAAFLFNEAPVFKIFAAAVAILIILRHYKNIASLIR